MEKKEKSEIRASTEAIRPEQTKSMLAQRVGLPETSSEAKIMKDMALATLAQRFNIPPGAGWDVIWYSFLKLRQIRLLEKKVNVTQQQIWESKAAELGLPNNLSAKEMGEQYGRWLYTIELELPEHASWQEIATAYNLDKTVKLFDVLTSIHATLCRILQLGTGVSMTELKRAAFGSGEDFSALLQNRAAQKPPSDSE